MYKLQVIAEKLNIRNSPVADPDFANWAGDMVSGDVFNAAQMVEGEEVDGNKNWYKDDGNRFVAAAWVTELVNDNDEQTTNGLTVSFNYNKLIQNIPDEWRDAGGKDIKVVIMDSGVAEIHNDIKIKDENYYDFYYDGTDKYDKCGHGSEVAGLIGGTAVAQGIRGIAPFCEIISYKTTSNTGATARVSLMKAIPEIKKLAELNEVVIVNCSWGVNTSHELDTLLRSIQNNVILICAAGNNADLLTASGPLQYPSSITSTISVGYISQDSSTMLLAAGDLNPALDYIFLGSSVKSCYIPEKDSYHDFDQCSMATALVTGIITSMISSLTTDERSNVDVAFIRNKLNAQLTSLPVTFTDSITIYKLKN